VSARKNEHNPEAGHYISSYLLNATTNQETVTGDPTISRITKIACCQAVSELKSNVIKPVPVAALMHRNSESTRLA